MLVAMRLAKAGYYNGDPQKILAVSASLVVSMLEYELFEADYEAQYIALNQKES